MRQEPDVYVYSATPAITSYVLKRVIWPGSQRVPHPTRGLNRTKSMSEIGSHTHAPVRIGHVGAIWVTSKPNCFSDKGMRCAKIQGMYFSSERRERAMQNKVIVIQTSCP